MCGRFEGVWPVVRIVIDIHSLRICRREDERTSGVFALEFPPSRTGRGIMRAPVSERRGWTWSVISWTEEDGMAVVTRNF